MDARILTLEVGNVVLKGRHRSPVCGHARLPRPHHTAGDNTERFLAGQGDSDNIICRSIRMQPDVRKGQTASHLAAQTTTHQHAPAQNAGTSSKRV